MRHGLGRKLVLLQSPVAFRDSEATGAGEYPFIAFLDADAAIALHDAGELWKPNIEFKGAAMAIAFVVFEVGSWSGGFFGHGWLWGNLDWS